MRVWDSSAVRAFAQRMGLGRQKHVEGNTLLVATRADAERRGAADFSTKAVPGTVLSLQLRKRTQAMGFEHRRKWSGLHKSLIAICTVLGTVQKECRICRYMTLLQGRPA
eukprot:3805633-Amphidinium_carterae.3